MDIRALIAGPPSEENAEKIVAWFDDLMNRIIRGDLMIGILSPDELDVVPDALRAAIRGGDEASWIALASWYQEPPLGEPDYEKAIAVLREAIAAEAYGAELELELARLLWFRKRKDTSEDERREAFRLTAAVCDEDPDDFDALYLLGVLTHAGFGTDKDPAKAFEIQKRAAELGSADAHFELYVHLSRGLGVERDDAAALEHNRKAAEEGHPRALYNMGAIYAKGEQVEQDKAAAADWYELACDAGNGRACATLAAMYAAGDGVEVDRERAGELFEEAEALDFDTSALKALVGWVDGEEDAEDEDEDEE